jgi:RHS repeat-associated protein
VGDVTTSYAYDTLGRLTSATASSATSAYAWGQSFVYDPFGNLLQQNVTSGGAPALSLTVDPTTNRISSPGFTYDAAGNLTSTDGSSSMYAYDSENRMVKSNGTSYFYGSAGELLFKAGPGQIDPSHGEFDGTFYFYGQGGTKLAELTYDSGWYGTTGGFVKWVYPEMQFGGRVVWSSNGTETVADRLGSAGFGYFPYGYLGGVCSNYTPTMNPGFATYHNDCSSGLDYAMNRYYDPARGRFTTPDPAASGTIARPNSWNRYAYTEGDPVNFNDPDGLAIYNPWYQTGQNWLNFSLFWGSMLPGPVHLPMLGLDGPGSGGGAGGGGIKILSQVKALMTNAIKSLGSNCQKVLPDQQTLLTDARDLNYVDARSGASGSQTIAQVAPNLAAYNGSGSLQSITTGMGAVILYGPPNGASASISSTVILGQQFWLDPPQGNNANFQVGQGVVLIHELLHYATQLSDDAFVTKYGVQVQSGTLESTSSAISRWLQNDCKN